MVDNLPPGSSGETATDRGRTRRGAGAAGDAANRRGPSAGLGPALRRAWVGYQRRLDEELAGAGFGDRGLPDGRVLRMCSGPAPTTISQIGRELGITRQRASKVVASLTERGYVIVSPSTIDRREKVVTPTPRAVEYLATVRKATRRIERELRRELGPDGFAALGALLGALGAVEDMRMREYLRAKSRAGGLGDV